MSSTIPEFVNPTGAADDQKLWRYDDATGQAKLVTHGSGLGPFFFGDGSDGTVTMSVDTALSKDMHYANLTINSGVICTTNGWRIQVSGTLTLNGTIYGGENTPNQGRRNGGWNGRGTGGILQAGQGVFNQFPNLGGGGIGTTGAGGAGAGDSSHNSIMGGTGGAGGSGSGGAGGAAGTASNSAKRGDYAAVLINAFLAGGFRTDGVSWLADTRATTGTCGGAGGGDGSLVGGGGGSAGPWTIVLANAVAGTGTIEANGGTGESVSTGNCGGGGGGGGGVVTFITGSLSHSLTITANGGAGGTKSGTGVNGSAGSAGVIYTFLGV